MTRPGAPARQRQASRPPARPAAVDPGRATRGWPRFVERYGWRAYALPLLAVVTVLALFTTTSGRVRDAIGAKSPSSQAMHRRSTPPDAAPTGQLKVDRPGGNAVTTALPAMQLPPGPKYTVQGNGTFQVLPGTSAVFGHGTLHRFDIEVENGITGVSLSTYSHDVVAALGDRRSWIADGSVALQWVSSGPVDFHVSLTSAMTVRALCGYTLPVESSCFDGGQSRVVLNVARWVRGTKLYASDLSTYRIYAVNHEVGHALGHNHAHDCLKNGLAPVMMEQTFGAKTASGKICQANPWPFPPGATDAPGAEQPGDAPDLEFYRRNAA